ncbi:hypothetical protein Dimus_016975 [Dionaea muscipula]
MARVEKAFSFSVDEDGDDMEVVADNIKNFEAEKAEEPDPVPKALQERHPQTLEKSAVRVMSTESSFDSIVSEIFSDDEYLFSDESDQALGDLIMFNILVSSEKILWIGCLAEDCHDDFQMQKYFFMNFCDTLKEKGLLRERRK